MFRKISFGLLVFSLLLAACGAAATPESVPVVTEPVVTEEIVTEFPIDSSITLTDGLGREVRLPGPAQRIISLAPSNTEILFYVGAGTQLIGRDEVSDYPPEALDLPTVGGWSGFSTETIVALEPDLVLAGEINSPELVAALEGLGLTVYFLANPITLEEMYTNLEIIAALTGHEAETASLVESLHRRVAAVDDLVATVPESDRPTVFYEFDASDPALPYTYGPGTFGDLLIRRAGGSNAGGQLDGLWVQMPAETLLVIDPQIIILGDAAWGESPGTVAARPGWDALSAVQTGMIFPFDDNLVSRPGPRLVDGLEALARLLHPDLFE
ncbi:MAG: cobalamin-binding protein [Anaerolineales bacterium]|nr:cobalamin-binding protein [Anaerolineales bacterium]